MKYNFDEKFDRTNTNTRKWQCDSDILPMDIADLDFKVCYKIQKELEKVALCGDYSYSYVRDEYYNSIISWHKDRFGLDVQKEEIKLCFGTCSVLHYLVMAFMKPGENVLVNIPCYEPFVLAIKANGCNVIENRLVLEDDRYIIDFKKLENDIIVNNVKMYILCNPQNPSGRIWDYNELCEIVRICEKHNVILVSDEVHRDILRKNEKFVSILSITKNAILCCSPNKTFNLGGLKGSYVIIKNENIRKIFFDFLKRVYITSPHVFMQSAHIAAYNDCRDWVSQLNEYIDENFKILEKFFKQNYKDIFVMKSQAGFLLWINMKKIFNDEEEMKSMFDRIKVKPVYGSYFSLPKNECWVRINIGTRKENVYEFIERFKTCCNIDK